MEERIYSMIAEILKIDTVEVAEHKGDEKIWDSLLRVEAIFAMEDEFGFQFEEEELAGLTTPEALCTATMKRIDTV